MEGAGGLRTYLVVIDETPEAEVALRFAARRASKTGGAVLILSVLPPQDFVAWGSVQATIEAEARDHAEEVISRALNALGEETDIVPEVMVVQGDPVAVIRQTIAERPQVAALVLGAAATGHPGPLIAHFAGAEAGSMPCPLMIVPGSLPRESLDRLS